MCIVCTLLPALAGCAAPCQPIMLILGAVTRTQKYQIQTIVAKLSLAVLISGKVKVEKHKSAASATKVKSHWTVMSVVFSKTEGHVFTKRS